jgi:hypothetical protein
MNEKLGSHHRDTLEKLFRHAGGNVEWRQVRSLLEALGTVSEEHDGRLRATLGGQTEVFRPPHTKEVGPQMMVDLRRFLTRAGYSAGR